MNLKTTASSTCKRKLTPLAWAFTLAALTGGAQAASYVTNCGTVEDEPPTSAFSKMFDVWATGIINIVDEVASAVPGYKPTKDVVDNLKNFSAAVKTGSAFNDLKNNLSKQEAAFRALAQTAIAEDKEATFNSSVTNHFAKYRGIDKTFDEWSTTMSNLDKKISEVLAIEKSGEGLGPETLISHMMLASEKIRLLKVKYYRQAWGLDLHDMHSTLVNEINYSKNQLNNKFVVYEKRATNSTTATVVRVSYDTHYEYAPVIRYNGLKQDEGLATYFRDRNAAMKAAEALKTCRIKELVNVAREKSKIAQIDNNLYAHTTQLKTIQQSMSRGRWTSTGQYTFSNTPEGVDSIVMELSKNAGPTCRIIQKNGTKQVGESSCSSATTSSLFAQSLRKNQISGVAANKITSLSIYPINDPIFAKNTFVYGSNYALGAKVWAVKGGVTSKDDVLHAQRATDGIKYPNPSSVSYGGLVLHTQGFGTSLDLGVIRHVGSIVINGLYAGLDGTRELVIKYVGRDGSIFATQNVTYKFPAGKFQNVTIVAPNTIKGLAGQPNVMSIQITSPGPAFRYAEIEVYKPIDNPL
jgi:hypothetical protein